MKTEPLFNIGDSVTTKKRQRYIEKDTGIILACEWREALYEGGGTKGIFVYTVDFPLIRCTLLEAEIQVVAK